MQIWLKTLGLGLVLIFLGSCSGEQTLPSVGISAEAPSLDASRDYHIGPGDGLDISVWHNPDLSSHVAVRPDGRISVALVGDIVAAGKTPMNLASDIQGKLKAYVKDPLVTVTPTVFVGPVANQVRVIGEAVQPRAIPYSANMTLLDLMIAVGGLTKYADGDRAKIVRVKNGKQETYHVELDSLIRDGDIRKNVAIEPGDVLIIPQRFF
jgi:polysaccharide biosynthesis/export protein